MAGIDLNRTSSGVLLTREESTEIISKAIEDSVVMRLARRIALPGRGLAFQTITGDPEAAWVTQETDIKPKGVHSLGTKIMQGYTLAVIEPLSKQFRRDKANLVNELIGRLPKALGKKFDQTVLTGTSADKPGDNFDIFAQVNAVDISSGGIYSGLIRAEETINENEFLINGYVLSPKARAKLLNAKDDNNRPLFLTDLKTGDTGSVLGQRAIFTNRVSKAATSTTAEQLGIAGDWSKCAYGVVEDVQVDITDEASVTINNTNVNLWERNMFAVRAEIEIGFMIDFNDAFVRLNNGADPSSKSTKDSKK